MDKTEQILPDSSEWYREQGKLLMDSPEPAVRSLGTQYILKAYYLDDNEASYIVGKMMLDGFLKPTSGDSKERALMILCKAANKGSIQARALLNSYCMQCYNNNVRVSSRTEIGPLVDFRGKRIRINRTGLMTPIDAVLEFEKGINRLTLSADIFLQAMMPSSIGRGLGKLF